MVKDTIIYLRMDLIIEVLTFIYAFVSVRDIAIILIDILNLFQLTVFMAGRAHEYYLQNLYTVCILYKIFHCRMKWILLHHEYEIEGLDVFLCNSYSCHSCTEWNPLIKSRVLLSGGVVWQQLQYNLCHLPCLSDLPTTFVPSHLYDNLNCKFHPAFLWLFFWGDLIMFYS